MSEVNDEVLGGREISYDFEEKEKDGKLVYWARVYNPTLDQHNTGLLRL